MDPSFGRGIGEAMEKMHSPSRGNPIFAMNYINIYAVRPSKKTLSARSKSAGVAAQTLSVFGTLLAGPIETNV